MYCNKAGDVVLKKNKVKENKMIYVFFDKIFSRFASAGKHQEKKIQV
jgi:hypothetical protein